MGEEIVPKETIDTGDEWAEDPIVTEPSFDQKASLMMAKYIFSLFAGVYVLCFVLIFGMMFMADATFDGGIELVRFMISSILPLITLAIGYYLGDRNP